MTRFSKLILFLLLAGSLAAQQNVQYSYDAAGRLTSASYGNGTAITYTYDTRGQSAAARGDGGRESRRHGFLRHLRGGRCTGGRDDRLRVWPRGRHRRSECHRTSLAHRSVGNDDRVVTDSQGTARLAKFSRAAREPGDLLNHPREDRPRGMWTIKVTQARELNSQGPVLIESVASGIYTANAQGTAWPPLWSFKPGFPFWPWHGHSIHPLRSEQHVLSR